VSNRQHSDATGQVDVLIAVDVNHEGAMSGLDRNRR
jgi:hypothetical protein